MTKLLQLTEKNLLSLVLVTRRDFVVQASRIQTDLTSFDDFTFA